MTPPVIARYLVGWRTARRYGVPAAMVATTTRRRLAGDWRGACEAARFDVRFELAQVRKDFGAELARRVEDDLRDLAPDLVRWHLPREPGCDDGLLDQNRPVPLAQYGDDNPIVLWARTPAYLNHPQRVELQLGPGHRVTPRRGRMSDPQGQVYVRYQVDSWVDTRDLWDARAAPGLRHRLGGGDRTPFFTRDGRRLDNSELPAEAPAGDPVALTEWVALLQENERFAEAWTVGGISIEFHEARRNGIWKQVRRGGTAAPEDWFDMDGYALVPALAAAARRWWAERRPSNAGGRAELVLMPRAKAGAFAIVLAVDDRADSATVQESNRIGNIPSAPRSWWQRLPDVELLRRGGLTLSGLHPLVRAGLFPDHPGDPDEYRPADPVELVDPEPARVRCRGEWHRVGWSDGRIAAFDHTADEAQRERVIRSLGGISPGCFTVTSAWRDGPVVSRPLRRLRRHGVLAMRHGDLTEFVRLLDLGLDPTGLRDDLGRGPLHYLAHLGSVPLLHRLLDAGLDINRRAGRGRTPLAWALFDRAPAAVVHALLDAGADPTVIDDGQANLLHLVRSADAAEFLPRLLAAGLDLEARDWRGHTPLLAQVVDDASAPAIQAVVAAGADPTVRSIYASYSVSDLTRQLHRYDLNFLRV